MLILDFRHAQRSVTRDALARVLARTGRLVQNVLCETQADEAARVQPAHPTQSQQTVQTVRHMTSTPRAGSLGTSTCCAADLHPRVARGV